MNEPDCIFRRVGGTPVHYDRFDDVRYAYGTQGKPRKQRATKAFAQRLDAAFEELWRVCPRGRAELVVTAGTWADRKGYHGLGRAFDLDGIFWPGGQTFLAISYPTQPKFYLAVEAVLRCHFGVVLGYLYNPAHRDHLHVDDGCEVGFDPCARSAVLFVQAVLARLLGAPVEANGAFDAATREHLARAQAALGIAGDLGDPEVWRGFLRAAARRAFAQAERDARSGGEGVRPSAPPRRRSVWQLRDRAPSTTAFIEAYRARRRRNRRSPHVEHVWVPWEMIAPAVKWAAIQAEDNHFLHHHGFDLEAVGGVLRARLAEKKRVSGASTISQQLAKNLWLSRKRSLWRKLQEAMLALQLEAFLSKERILEIYLNVAEFGSGIYGVEAAARQYYDKAAIDLDLGEAAHLAAALPRPRSWHPGCGELAYEARAAEIEANVHWRGRKGYFASLGWVDPSSSTPG
ncbi:MAG: monofunctional biosynthetic peptidoglycan transglycosylase [Proteobacteria bacterium]|nr:monofunctional biosynthetic peptidoglycan transglycosylase [Pseudomonadota bacterium]